jgi:hypothetical protein
MRAVEANARFSLPNKSILAYGKFLAKPAVCPGYPVAFDTDFAAGKSTVLRGKRGIKGVYAYGILFKYLRVKV